MKAASTALPLAAKVPWDQHQHHHLPPCLSHPQITNNPTSVHSDALDDSHHHHHHHHHHHYHHRHSPVSHFIATTASETQDEYFRHLPGLDTKLSPEERWLASGIVHTDTDFTTSPHGKGHHNIALALPQSAAVNGRRRLVNRSMSLPVGNVATMTNVSMENIDESAPGSPPELSYSKSSKSSSSLNSDDDLSVSDSGGSASKDAHFEEVVLEDADRNDVVDGDSNLPPASRPTLRRPPPKSFHTGNVARRRSGTSPQLQLRPMPMPMPNGPRQQHPSLQGAVSNVLRDQSLNLPNGRTKQRAASSPTSPYMPTPQRTPSRSPSPSKPFMQNAFSSYPSSSSSSPPQPLTTTTPKASFESQGSAPRKHAWQPGRKTVKELEAEYNDEDEDVPDEAILENVPISPLPGHYATLKSPTTSTAGMRSTTPSPNRRPYGHLHSANIPKRAKRPSALPPPNQYSSPRSPKHGRPPMMPHSATVSPFPPHAMHRKERSKSWTEDLNAEARELSQKLEEYAEGISTKRHSGPGSGMSSASSSPPRAGDMKPLQRAKTSITEIPTPIPSTLPPLQKGNVMIDPLPISKEKEAVLSRTRPSWLPPKDQKEERKHLKEFQQMMARAAEAEKKRALKEQESRENKEEMQGSLARIWDQHVLPNWEAVVKEPRTRELWWRGVTPRSRGEVWQKAIGNELELTAASYDAALSRAHAVESKIQAMPSEERSASKEAAWMDAIRRDVSNTLPETKMYCTRDSPLHRNLTDVLKAYSMYRSDVGYVYGTHLVAGIICLFLQPPEAFVLLANILNRPLPLAFLVHDQPAMSRTYELTLQTLKYKYTKLHDHLTSPSLDLKPEEFLDPIFRCLFAYNLPHECVSRIWDIFVFEGDKTLIRAAIAVLGKLEHKLYTKSKEEVLEILGWRNEGFYWDFSGQGSGSEVDEFVSLVREAGKVDGSGGGERGS